MRTAYTYDSSMKRLSTLITQKLQNGTPVATYQNLTYQYDLKGNITTLTDSFNSITHTYTYDNLDRLVSAVGTGQGSYSQTYGYDRIGNISSKSDVGSYSYTYGNKPHAVRTAGSVALQYDACGNMTQKAAGGITLDMTWNEKNKPSLIRRNGTDYIRLTYDGDGVRVRKENLQSGAVIRYYGEAYEERSTIGVIHLFAGSNRVVSIRSDGNRQFYHGNHLGSASVVTDAGGTMKEKIEYFPYGTYRDRQDYDPTFPNVNYTFTDQEDDDETGFFNYNARLYDPLIGRFISADPLFQDLSDPQTLNRYSYVRNNPIIYTDPSGYDFEEWDYGDGDYDYWDYYEGGPPTFPVSTPTSTEVVGSNSYVPNPQINLNTGQYNFWTGTYTNGPSPSSILYQGPSSMDTGQSLFKSADEANGAAGNNSCISNSSNGYILFKEPDWCEGSNKLLTFLDKNNTYFFGHYNGETMGGYKPEKLIEMVPGDSKGVAYLIGCNTIAAAEQMASMSQKFTWVCGTTERIWLNVLTNTIDLTPRPPVLGTVGWDIPNLIPFVAGKWVCFPRSNK